MNSKKANKKKQKSCLTDPSYCSDSNKDSELFPSLNNLPVKIKTFIFIFVMLAAAGVTIFSLSNKISAKAKGSDTKKGDSFNTSQIYKTCPLDSLKSLNSVASNKDFVFILYPGKNKKENNKIVTVMEETSKEISKKRIKVGTFIIKKEGADYKKWIDTYGKNNLPAVVGISKGCGSDIVKEKITKKELLASYIRASKPVRGGSCCPK